MREWTDRIAADVWVLTETHDGFTPGHEHSCKSDPGRDGYDEPGHRWVTIWSKWQLEPLPTTDRRRTAAARVVPPGDAPFLVFGTVLPWHGDNWHGHASAGGLAFREALELQRADWKNLSREYPDHEFFVLGDFNQDLVHPRYYGARSNRAALLTTLDECGLVAHTAGAGDPIRRDSGPWACIDHICGRRESRWRPEPAVRWPDAPKPMKRLSDHFGLAITFVRG